MVSTIAKIDEAAKSNDGAFSDIEGFVDQLRRSLEYSLDHLVAMHDDLEARVHRLSMNQEADKKEINELKAELEKRKLEMDSLKPNWIASVRKIKRWKRKWTSS